MLSRSLGDRCISLIGSTGGTPRTSYVCRVAETANVSASVQVPASSSSQIATPALQTYIQDSANYSSAELSARLWSMTAARRRSTGAPAARRTSSVAATAATAPAAPASAPPAMPAVQPVQSYAAGGTSSNGWSSNASTSSSSMTSSATLGNGASSSSSSATSSNIMSTGASNGSNGNSSSTSFDATQQQQEEEEYSYAGSGTSSSSPEAAAAAAGGPLPDSLAGLSASEKLAQLQQVQQLSRKALQAGSSSPYYAGAPKTVDIRMYEQLVAAHNRQSQKLTELEAYIVFQEEIINGCNQDLMDAFELLKQIGMEYGTTSRMANSAVAAVQFGVDPQDAVEKIGKLQQRLSTLEQAIQEHRQEFGKRVVRKVPVEWVGVANEVQIMGDFDGWTRGQDLSAEDVTSDTVYSRFEGSLMLRPGSYRVKFLVDGEWRLASGWPSEDDGKGNEVNVLTVT